VAKTKKSDPKSPDVWSKHVEVDPVWERRATHYFVTVSVFLCHLIVLPFSYGSCRNTTENTYSYLTVTSFQKLIISFMTLLLAQNYC